MKIFFVNGVRSGDEVEFALPEITIGREDGNILRIPTEGVSRFHACLRRNPAGKWTICDQGSTNGVKVNRMRISGERELAEGDLVEIGDQTFRVTDLASAPPPVIFNPIPSITPVAPAEVGNGTRPLEPEIAPGTAVEPLRSTSDDRTERLVDLASLQGNASALFGGGAPDVAKPSGENGGAASPRRKTSRRLSNTAYYTIIVCLVVIAVAACIKMFSQQRQAVEEKKSAAGLEEPPLTVFYEKEVILPDNVFRFAMQLEDRTVVFTIDDINSQRHYERKFENISHTGIGILRSRINSSGVLTLAQPDAPRGADVEKISRRLVIAALPQVKELRIIGKVAPSAFEEVESAITEFAETYGLQTISLTPEELRAQAEVHFRKAEDLYGNREARPGNLRDAIMRYRLVVSSLEQFSPPLPMWEQARRRLEEAEALRARKLQNLEYERNRAGGIKDYAALRQVFIETMALADEDSKVYDTARQRLFKLDRWLEERGK